MPVVLDANLLVAFATDDDRAPSVAGVLQRWLMVGEDLHPPALLPYEVASGLTRLVVAGAIPAGRLSEAWQTVMQVPIAYHAFQEQGDRAIMIALQLGRQSAYDAA